MSLWKDFHWHISIAIWASMGSIVDGIGLNWEAPYIAGFFLTFKQCNNLVKNERNHSRYLSRILRANLCAKTIDMLLTCTLSRQKKGEKQFARVLLIGSQNSFFPLDFPFLLNNVRPWHILCWIANITSQQWKPTICCENHVVSQPVFRVARKFIPESQIKHKSSPTTWTDSSSSPATRLKKKIYIRTPNWDLFYKEGCHCLMSYWHQILLKLSQ